MEWWDWVKVGGGNFLAIVLASYAAVRYLSRTVKDSIIKEIRADLEIELNRFRARYATAMGVHMYERNVEYAIRLAEQALPVVPQHDKLLELQLKSNLAYYYAKSKKIDKREKAFSLASEASDNWREHKRFSWVINLGYVMLRFARNKEDQQSAMHFLQSLKDYPEATRDQLAEIEDYLREVEPLML